jgi:hypothetical protein
MTYQKPLSFLMRGGLDLTTPRATAGAGTLLAAQNYEVTTRGYRRVDGIERFDGRLRPSDAFYYYLTYNLGDTAIVAGNTLTGGTSGATCIAIANATILTGAIGTSNAAGSIFVRSVTGTFVPGEDLLVAASQVADVVAAPVLDGAPTAVIHAAAIAAETARRRALIAEVPGSGPVRGILNFVAANAIYAFRDNVGGTACDIYLATTSGWSLRTDLGATVSFTNGSVAFAENDTLTRGAYTATVERVVLQSGSWGAGTAAGYLVVSAGLGAWVNGGGTGTPSGGAATFGGGAPTNVTLPPGGRYRFVTHTFGGAARSSAVYFTNGVGYAHEFDGTSLAPLRTGLGVNVDKPTHVAAFAEHLFLGYSAGALLFSGIGNPGSFLTIDGAGEIGFGDTITELMQDASTALVIGARNKIGYLVGTSADDFVLKIITDSSGMKANSGVQAFKPMYVDDRGIRDLSTTQEFGDWVANSVSEGIAPYFVTKDAAGTEPVAAIHVKTKNQYRLFFDDDTGLTAYLGRRDPELTPFTMPFTVNCACVGSLNADSEILLAGDADSGMVYLLDAGTSFDGSAIDAWMVTHFVSPSGDNSQDSRWHKAVIECDATLAQASGITMQAQFNYGNYAATPDTVEAANDVVGIEAHWEAEEWADFMWNEPLQGEATAALNGYGYNCAIAIRSDSAVDEPHTISMLRLHYSPRRFRR